jgi:hypothetical protein
MPRILKNLRIDEVSCVLKGANPGARVLIRKADDDPPYLFNDIMKQREIQPPNSATDAAKAPLSAKLNELVTAMVEATGGRLHPQRAARWLLHTEQGQTLLAQHTKKEEQMPDINKMISIMEDCLMATVTKRDGESYAQSFSRKFENDIGFRKQWRDLTEAKHLQSLNLQKRQGVGTATLTPTSVGVDDINDPMEAMRLLNEMATKQGRKFEDVFADPNNKWLAGKTYTGAQRPTASSTSGSELQR